METFVVEGRWAVEALLDAPFSVVEICLEKGRHADLISRLEEGQVPFRLLDKADLDRHRGYAFHRGVFAVVEKPASQTPAPDFLRNADRLAVPLRLADPGNLGTVIRSAVAFGSNAIVVEQGRGADLWNAKCIRASATAVFQVPIFEVGSLAREIEQWKEAGLVIFGTSISERAVSIRDVAPARRSAILLGSEEDGLPEEIEQLCDELVHIPMADGMDSLNVGASAAIAFWELWG